MCVYTQLQNYCPEQVCLSYGNNIERKDQDKFLG